jgi:hypothetical protein
MCFRGCSADTRLIDTGESEPGRVDSIIGDAKASCNARRRIVTDFTFHFVVRTPLFRGWSRDTDLNEQFGVSNLRI